MRRFGSGDALSIVSKKAGLKSSMAITTQRIPVTTVVSRRTKARTLAVKAKSNVLVVPTSDLLVRFVR
jgi:hypothetical protein